jgi:hypothetical protein
MKPTRTQLPVFLLLAWLALLPGCHPTAARMKRPVPGDRVTPHLYAPPWRAGRQAVLNTYLRAQGPGRPAEFLRLEEVPEDTDLRAAVTFYDGDEVLGDPTDARLALSPC